MEGIDIEKSIELPGGRRLGYAEYGPLDGFPVVAFHGTPGARLERLFSHDALEQFNVRLIVVERPGYGLSDFHDGRTLLGWPDDMTRFADALGLDSFSVTGFSGGGPYAAACAYKIPGRLVHTALISSAAPFSVSGLTDGMLPDNRALFEAARDDFAAVAQQLAVIVDSPETLFALFEVPAPAPDKSALSETKFRAMYQANLAESISQGMEGLAYDMAVVADPWGFDPAAITADVSVWYGEKDVNIPPAMGRYLADAIPACREHALPDDGHFLAPAYEAQILRALSGN